MMDEMGWDLLKDGIEIHPFGEMPDKPIIQTKEDLMPLVHSITHAEVVHFCINMTDVGDGGTEYYMFRLDIFAHAGYPGGESDKYLGRIELHIEENGFALLMGMYAK